MVISWPDNTLKERLREAQTLQNQFAGFEKIEQNRLRLVTIFVTPFAPDYLIKIIIFILQNFVMATIAFQFNDLVERIYDMPLEDKLELKSLLEHNISEIRRNEL